MEKKNNDAFLMIPCMCYFFFANVIDYVTFTKNSFPLQSIYVKSYYLEYAKHPI